MYSNVHLRSPNPPIFLIGVEDLEAEVGATNGDTRRIHPIEGPLEVPLKIGGITMIIMDRHITTMIITMGLRFVLKIILHNFKITQHGMPILSPILIMIARRTFTIDLLTITIKKV